MITKCMIAIAGFNVPAYVDVLGEPKADQGKKLPDDNETGTRS